MLNDERQVRDARHPLSLVEQRVKSLEHRAAEWAKKNRALAFAGRRPFAKEIKKAVVELETKQQRWNELRRHPGLVEKATRIAAEHNAKIKVGKKKVAELAPALKVAKEAEKELAVQRGRDRDLRHKLGLKLGRSDQGMEL